MTLNNFNSNYGGRTTDYRQNIKQFFSTTPFQWIYKKMASGKTVLTPSDKTHPILIDNTLIVTGMVYQTSDKRLKENITQIPDEYIDNLCTLNPILFTYINDTEKHSHFGVIAQDVENILPQLVNNNLYNGYKTVNYVELIPLILAKIQKMQMLINELQNKVDKI